MQRFRNVKTLQKFSSVHAQVQNHFNQERHLITRQVYKQRRSIALADGGRLPRRASLASGRVVQWSVNPVTLTTPSRGVRSACSWGAGSSDRNHRRCLGRTGTRRAVSSLARASLTGSVLLRNRRRMNGRYLRIIPITSTAAFGALRPHQKSTRKRVLRVELTGPPSRRRIASLARALVQMAGAESVPCCTV